MGMDEKTLACWRSKRDKVERTKRQICLRCRCETGLRPSSSTISPRSRQSSRLRADALHRVEAEERAAQAPVYGGPPPRDDRPAPDHDEPAPVYGGPPPFNGGGSMTRRRGLWGLLLAALAAIVGIIAWLLKGRRIFPQEFPCPARKRPFTEGPHTHASTQSRRARTAISHFGHSNSKWLFVDRREGWRLGDPNSAPHGVALTTGATTAGPLETFTLIWVNKSERTPLR